MVPGSCSVDQSHVAQPSLRLLATHQFCSYVRELWAPADEGGCSSCLQAVANPGESPLPPDHPSKEPAPVRTTDPGLSRSQDVLYLSSRLPFLNYRSLYQRVLA
jgi:hypothetical protein